MWVYIELHATVRFNSWCIFHVNAIKLSTIYVLTDNVPMRLLFAVCQLDYGSLVTAK